MLYEIMEVPGLPAELSSTTLTAVLKHVLIAVDVRRQIYRKRRPEEPS